MSEENDYWARFREGVKNLAGIYVQKTTEKVGGFQGNLPPLYERIRSKVFDTLSSGIDS